MTEPHDCPAMRSLLAELATGAAAGHDRAWALGHIAGCPACRAELAELAKVADGLLLLAPPSEPPPEFESAVLARLEAAPGPSGQRPGHAAPRPSRWRPGRAAPRPSWRRPGRAALAAAAAVAALLVASGGTAAIVYQRGEQDRAVAEQYRQTLEVADGRYLRAARLVTAAGERSGTVFLYQGHPSWLMVTVTAAPTDGRHEIRVLERGGAAHTVGSCQLAGGAGTAGYRLDIPVAQVAGVQLRQGEVVQLTATLRR